jgi:hypothetical protein
MKTTIENIKERFGTVSKLAKLLDCTPQNLYQLPDGIEKPLTKAVQDRIDFAYLRMKNPEMFKD